MTPQLRQAIKLLQFSNIEVTAFVEEELERNPLLERDEARICRPPSAPAPDQLPARASEARLTDTADARVRDAAAEAAPPLDADCAERLRRRRRG